MRARTRWHRALATTLHSSGRATLRALAGLVGLVALLLVGPLSVMASGEVDLSTPWYVTRQDRTGLAPDPAAEPGAVVQVYGARAVRWRGAFAIHPWIAVKPAGAPSYTTYQVIGWRAMRGGRALVTTEGAEPDRHWYGAAPQLLADHRGPAAQALIERIEAAVQRYPWPDQYRAWPGPNSNTFVAWVAREVPELGLDLPPTAIGKDWLGPSTFLAPAPSGTGWQVSLWGVAGATLALEEGLELQLLGLGLGVDVNDVRLRLPGWGWWGLSDAAWPIVQENPPAPSHQPALTGITFRSTHVTHCIDASPARSAAGCSPGEWGAVHARPVAW